MAAISHPNQRIRDHWPITGQQFVPEFQIGHSGKMELLKQVSDRMARGVYESRISALTEVNRVGSRFVMNQIRTLNFVGNDSQTPGVIKSIPSRRALQPTFISPMGFVS